VSAAVDVVSLGASALSAACALTIEATSHLRDAVGRLLARDVRDSRPPARVVLVLDDSAAARASIVDALATRLSVPILEADSAACARVRAYDRPAVVVADWLLRRDTSREYLAQRPPWMRAVLVSSATTDDASMRAIALSVGARYVPKPDPARGEASMAAEYDALASLVRDLLDDATV
jgi:PleD family two-component response regulator